MVNPKKTSDELKCLLCAIEDYRTTLPMRDCDKDKKLFSLINVELQLQAAIDSKKFTLGYLFSLVCVECRKVLKSIYEFRMRSLHSLHQLRMKFINTVDQQQTTSSAAPDDWIKIVNVVSQRDSGDVVSDRVNSRRSTRTSTHTNGGSINGEFPTNGTKSPKTDSLLSDDSSRRRSHNSHNGVRTRRQKLDLSDRGSRNRSNGDESEVTSNDRWHEPGLHDVSGDLSENNDGSIIDVYDNEIYNINYNNQNQNPEISSTNIISPSGGVISDNDVGHKTPVDKTIEEFPDNHSPFLQVLYSTAVESALETESGGRVDKQNDKITSAGKRKNAMCNFCHKMMKNQLAVNRHMISTHFHDKRRAMRDHREQKTVDKSFVCETCHSSFRTSNLLKKHEKSHNRMICEICKAEYLNKMDFDWHKAQCSGEKRSVCTVPGAWTRSRSRQRIIVPDKFDDPARSTQTAPESIQLSTPATQVENESTTAAIVSPSSRLSTIDKDEHLEKWIEESKKAIKLDQIEPVPQPVQQKRSRKSRKRKRSVTVKRKRKSMVADNDSVVEEDINIETPIPRGFRASTPFPTRRRSSVYSTFSDTRSRPLSCTSQQTTRTNLDSWARCVSEVEDNDDDNMSVYSGFTGISSSGRSDITERTSASARSARSRPLTACSVRTIESITSSITRLSKKPRTRTVATSLKKLELELSFSQSRASGMLYCNRRTRKMKRHPFFINKDKLIVLLCSEEECAGRPEFRTLEDLMNHHTECHRILRLFRCIECKARFTQKNFLVQHMATHNAGPYMCPLCDSNIETLRELRGHFKLHEIKSIPCSYDYCDKSFLKDTDKAQHVLIYHVRELNMKKEEEFVRDFLRKRALAGGSGTIGGSSKSRQPPVRRTSTGNRRSIRKRVTVDLESQRRYVTMLGDMHSSSVTAASSPTPGCSHYPDSSFTPPVKSPGKIQSRHRSSEKSDPEDVHTGLGVCDTLMYDDNDLLNTMTIPNYSEFNANANSTTADDTTESEFEHVSTRSSILKYGKKEARISLTARRRGSKHVVTYEPHIESSFKLFRYSDAVWHKDNCVVNKTPKGGPWRY